MEKMITIPYNEYLELEINNKIILEIKQFKRATRFENINTIKKDISFFIDSEMFNFLFGNDIYNVSIRSEESREK